MDVAVDEEAVIDTLGGVPGPLQKSLLRFLLSRCLDQDLDAWVRTRRDAGKSWESIAAEMSAALQIPEDVTPIRRQTLQKWFPQ